MISSDYKDLYEQVCEQYETVAQVVARQHALIEEMREALKEADEVFECCGHGKSGAAVMCRSALAKAEAQQ